MAEISPQQWTLIRDQLAAQCGLYLDDSRQTQGMNMVRSRLTLLGLTPASYTALVLTPAGSSEIRELAEQLANHETQFFRNPAHFRLLQQQILPELHRLRTPLRPLRIWSAGCATGEEPYSIAITALEALNHPPARPVRIWGTDLSAAALGRAKKGLYRGRSVTNLHSTQRRWFAEQDGGLQVGTAIQSLVQFEQHNLLDPFPGWATDIDIVFCQNVTIYFQLATCRQLISRIYEVMAEGSYLFLGFSETLWGIFDRFETVECEGAFLYRKGSPDRPPRTINIRRVPQQVPQPARPPAVTRPAGQRVPQQSTTVTQERDPETVLATVRQLRDRGSQAAALQLLNNLAPGHRTPAVVAITAQLHADLGEHEQAAAEARRALELDVMQDTAYLVLGMLELQNGAWLEASRHLERALYLVPESPSVSFYLAESYRLQKRPEAAIREYRNTIRKLKGVAPATLIDGVAAEWLNASCKRWLTQLESSQV